MIDWHAIKPQIDELIEKQKESAERIRQEQRELLQSFSGDSRCDWESDWQGILERAHSASSDLIPDCSESPTQTYPVNTDPGPATVCTTDGSQIFPSRHESASAALIHISRIRIRYGDESHMPLIDSVAEAVMENELENWESEDDSAPSFTDWVSDERTLRELTELHSLIEAHPDTLCMCDGSLILWRLAGRKSQKYEKKRIEQYVNGLKKFHEKNAPIAGYISQSGTREIVKLILFAEGRLDEKALSRRSIPFVTDSMFFGRYLKTGERSTVFHSRSQIMKAYGDQAISYFFLNVGSEAARIELPRWAAEKKEIVDFVAEQCLQQAQLGGGYPILIAEAHEQAVLRGPDRQAFFAMIEDAMLSAGMAPSLSVKELRKRVSVL